MRKAQWIGRKEGEMNRNEMGEDGKSEWPCLLLDDSFFSHNLEEDMRGGLFASMKWKWKWGQRFYSCTLSVIARIVWMD